MVIPFCGLLIRGDRFCIQYICDIKAVGIRGDQIILDNMIILSEFVQINLYTIFKWSIQTIITSIDTKRLNVAILLNE